MDAVTTFFDWLFRTREGVLCLIAGGIVLFLIIALILERSTKKRYYNHERSEGDFDLFEDAESGWSDFEDDNV